MEQSDLFVQILSSIVAGLVWGCHYAIQFVDICYRLHPSLTLFAVRLVALYALYKTLRKTVKVMVNFFVLAVKSAILLIFVVVGLALYLRGIKFFTQDIHFITNYIKRARLYSTGEKGRGSGEWLGDLYRLFTFAKSNPEGVYEVVNDKIMNEYGIEVDLSYLDYLKDNFEEYGTEQDFSYDKINDIVGTKINEFLHHNNWESAANDFLANVRNHNR